MNIGKKGIYHNLGIPGSGLYSRSRTMSPKEKSSEDYTDFSSSPAKESNPVLIAVVAIAFLIGFFGLFSPRSNDTPALSSKEASHSSYQPASVDKYVSASALNCRSIPDAKAQKVKTFRKGEAVVVRASQDGWSEVVDIEKNCWVASNYLSDDPPSVTPPENLTSTAMPFVGAATLGGSATSRPRTKAGSGSGCSCKGGNVCYGPRGGRYCITSGGNKRYGV